VADLKEKKHFNIRRIQQEIPKILNFKFLLKCSAKSAGEKSDNLISIQQNRG